MTKTKGGRVVNDIKDLYYLQLPVQVERKVPGEKKKQIDY